MTGNKIMTAQTPGCINSPSVLAVLSADATSRDNLRSDTVSNVGRMISTHVTNTASPIDLTNSMIQINYAIFIMFLIYLDNLIEIIYGCLDYLY